MNALYRLRRSVLTCFPQNYTLLEAIVHFFFLLSKMIAIYTQIKGRGRKPAQLFEPH